MNVQNATAKETIENYLLITWLIKNQKIRDFTQRFIQEKVPDYFMWVPASASGKYHPMDSLGDGGLARHSMSVAIIAQAICELEYLQVTPVDKSFILAACLLHDTFKQGRSESGTTVRTHPNIAAQEIYNFGKEIGEEKIGKAIATLVVSHMGQWGNQKPGSRVQFLVHLADFIASRRWITIDYTDTIERAKRAKEALNHK